MQHLGKGALRVAKNISKGYSDTQALVRDATSNDPWGPSGTQMNQVAQLTYNQNDFVEIVEMLDKRLNDKGKNWRHVFKSLQVLDYCLHSGSENVCQYFKNSLYIIKTLKEFQYIDEDGKDQGANVRQKAKDVANLLTDAQRLRDERRSRASMRDRMIRGMPGGSADATAAAATPAADSSPQPGADGSGGVSRRRRKRNADEDLKRALEESKRAYDAEAGYGRLTTEDEDIARAIKLSQEEAARRKANAQNPPPPSEAPVAVPQSSNNPFPLIDVSDGSSDGLQPQFASLQPQFTSFNPWQQQAQQEAVQADYLRQQQEWQMMQQHQMQAQATGNPWFQQQQQPQTAPYGQQPQMSLAPQPTGFGSNNPFAPAQQSSPPIPAFPTFSTGSTGPPNGYSQSPQGPFGAFGNNIASPTPNFGASSGSPPPPTNGSGWNPNANASPGPGSRMGATTPRAAVRSDSEHAHLANIFANRDDGQDTFGNVGALRYGQTDAGRAVAATGTGGSGHNPFAMRQQQQQQQQQQMQNGNQPFFSF
ncbi:ENTH-domain-containing protein [Coniophora puteana RWD-64-598 SS2]|uniref:ENTH-domain-containing protein n=1 Tax=Coniophora puteana (strain RWD-64-598) TaxID=741705 RepID=A0A5M3MES0_CONPW|nr:ENTH-domain-containing protein [Coniophora puteana RWD-64-598 SS2]EIW77759.1 ENTH-domain-containing protein [Coniophora puteana RWD-64-598 SS2]